MKTIVSVTIGFGCTLAIHVLFSKIHLLPVIIPTAVIECAIGSLITGYLMKKNGMILGIIVSYAYIMSEIIVYAWMLHSYSTAVVNAKLYNGYDLNWQSFSYATAVFVGLLGGKLGEILSKLKRS